MEAFSDIFVDKCHIHTKENSISIIKNVFLEIVSKTYIVFEEKLKISRHKENKGYTEEEVVDNPINIKIGEYNAEPLRLPEKKLSKEALTRKQRLLLEEKEWEESTIIVVQSYAKVIRILFSLAGIEIR